MSAIIPKPWAPPTSPAMHEPVSAAIGLTTWIAGAFGVSTAIAGTIGGVIVFSAVSIPLKYSNTGLACRF
jgi:hypothetical protein